MSNNSSTKESLELWLLANFPLLMGEHGKPLGQPEVIASLQDLVKVLAPWIEDKLLEARIDELKRLERDLEANWYIDQDEYKKYKKERISKLKEE